MTAIGSGRSRGYGVDADDSALKEVQDKGTVLLSLNIEDLAIIL